MREMNEIERKFYDAFIKNELELFKKCHIKVRDMRLQIPLIPQYPYGGYVLDFVYEVDAGGGFCFRFCIEIDGQESHKTKAQRLSDYQRERYLQAHDFHIIRFTASEVYVDVEGCVSECKTLIRSVLNNYTDYAEMNLDYYQQAENDLKGA